MKDPELNLHFLHVFLRTQEFFQGRFDLASDITMVLYLEQVERASIK